AAAQAPSGAALFDNHCVSCHAGTDPRTPTVAVLKQRTPSAIVDALTSGVMRQQGSELSDAEKRAIAEYLGSVPAAPAAAAGAGACTTGRSFDPTRGPQWSGWAPELNNTRFQPAAQAGLTAEQVPKLTLKWAFGFPNATSARAQPAIAGGRLFVGSHRR